MSARMWAHLLACAGCAPLGWSSDLHFAFKLVAQLHQRLTQAGRACISPIGPGLPVQTSMHDMPRCTWLQARQALAAQEL